MRRLLAALTGLLLLALAMPVAAASFDCAKARTKAEKLICKDPQLSRQDEDLARAYGEALKAWDGRIAAYVKMTQRAWVGSRALLPPDQGVGGILCFDDANALACLRTAYADRIAVLNNPGFRLGGIYARGQDFLRILPLPTGLEFAYARIDANANQATDVAEPVRVAPGQAAMTFPLAGKGPDACTLDAAFAADAVTLVQKGPCSGAKLGGRWARDLARDPEAELF